MTPWKYYVYEFTDGETIAYVGKGSGKRLEIQRRRFKLPGQEIARFEYERDAFDFELARIRELRPKFNLHPGIRKRMTEADLMEEMGTRRYLDCWLLDNCVSIEKLMEGQPINWRGLLNVAMGPKC